MITHGSVEPAAAAVKSHLIILLQPATLELVDVRAAVLGELIYHPVVGERHNAEILQEVSATCRHG